MPYRKVKELSIHHRLTKPDLYCGTLALGRCLTIENNEHPRQANLCFPCAMIFLVGGNIGLASFTSASPLHTPAPGTAERKAILDVDRKYVEDAVAVKPIVFHDVSMSVKDGWAYVVAHPRDSTGREIWVMAQFKNFDPFSYSLIRKTKAGWKLVEFTFGNDASSQFRRRNPKAPAAIFFIAATVRRKP